MLKYQNLAMQVLQTGVNQPQQQCLGTTGPQDAHASVTDAPSTTDYSAIPKNPINNGTMQHSRHTSRGQFLRWQCTLASDAM